MNVALVHDWLNGMRGGEKVLEALLDLWPEADIYTLFYEPDEVSKAIRSRRVFASPLQRLPGAKKIYRHLLPLFPWAIERFRLDKYDLVISVSHCAAKGARAASPRRHLCYCLTPMRYVWSQYEAYFGEESGCGWATRLAMRATRERLRRWDRRTSDRAGRFVAISQTVAGRVKEAYGREAGVIYPPVDTDFFRSAGVDVEDGYCLVASALAPYKRVDLAIEACNRLGAPLKIVGTGPEEARLRRMAGPGTEFLGRVAAEQLRNLYRGCRVLIHPAEEDFGIAPLEAQACGRPVVAFGRGGLRETVIDGATGTFFAEQTVESLAECLRGFDAARFDPAVVRSNALRFSRARFLEAFRRETERFLDARSTGAE